METTDPQEDLTLLLKAAGGGDEDALDRLMPHVYAELRRIAVAHVRRERGSSLQPTEIVHEAWMRLLGGAKELPDFENRRVFFGAASRAMRRILIERARRRRGAGDGLPVTFHDLGVPSTEAQVDLIALDQAMTKLEARSADLAEIVQLRFFLGLGPEEIAAALDTSVSTISRQWRFARAWLYRSIEGVERPE